MGIPRAGTGSPSILSTHRRGATHPDARRRARPRGRRFGPRYNPDGVPRAQEERAMPSDPRRRQKKLERRSTRRKEKKHLQVREHSAGLAERLTEAARFPVLHCWIGDSLKEQGIGWVVLSRELPNRQVAAVSFLVDPYCLGVKGAFAEVLDRSSYDGKYLRKMTREMPSRSVSPAEARKLLE